MSIKHEIVEPVIALVITGLFIYGVLFVVLTVSEWLSSGSLSVGLSF